MIKYQEIIEGNLKAEKCTGDFGGANMWSLYVMTTQGWWESVQWMDVNKVQMFFKTKLPVYKDVTEKRKYVVE